MFNHKIQISNGEMVEAKGYLDTSDSYFFRVKDEGGNPVLTLCRELVYVVKSEPVHGTE